MKMQPQLYRVKTLSFCISDSRAREVELSEPSESRVSQVAGVRHRAIYTVGIWFCLSVIVNVGWFFPLGIRKYVTFFFFHFTSSYS